MYSTYLIWPIRMPKTAIWANSWITITRIKTRRTDPIRSARSRWVIRGHWINRRSTKTILSMLRITRSGLMLVAKREHRITARTHPLDFRVLLWWKIGRWPAPAIMRMSLQIRMEIWRIRKRISRGWNRSSSTDSRLITQLRLPWIRRSAITSYRTSLPTSWKFAQVQTLTQIWAPKTQSTTQRYSKLKKPSTISASLFWKNMKKKNKWILDIVLILKRWLWVQHSSTYASSVTALVGP